MNKAFTLIELLAVIAILAIILLIAVPMVLSTIASSKQGAFKTNAQMVIKTVDLKTASDSTFDYRTLTADNIDDLGLDNSNYSSLSVTKQYGKTKVTIVGQGSWNGLAAYGTTDAMNVTSITVFAESTDESNANPPEISSNMIPVYYDTTCTTTNCWKKADVNNLNGTYKWYDYNAKKWANAVTVTDASRSAYQQDDVGTTILDNDILTFMVWIPRYKYYINSTSKLIYPVFESTLTPKSTGNATSFSTYRTHPAFTFGTQELSGIWVSKFEVTNTIGAIYSKPNMSSLTNQTVSSYFTAIRNMESSVNIYGYVPTEVDTHMILNTEWGAVAYLSYSTYGKNSEVWINNSSTYITGCDGATVSAASASGCANVYNSTTGMNASTTGNVYGVYDMSGGSAEYAMGTYNNDILLSGFISLPDSKYYNIYTDTNIGTACSGGVCYGQALSETSGWNADYTDFVSDSWPWLVRGGDYSLGATAGVFAYRSKTGEANSYHGTRIVTINSL